MVGLVIYTQSLRLEGLGGDVVAPFLLARYGHLNVRSNCGDAAQSAGSWLGRGRTVGSVQLEGRVFNLYQSISKRSFQKQKKTFTNVICAF